MILPLRRPRSALARGSRATGQGSRQAPGVLCSPDGHHTTIPSTSPAPRALDLAAAERDPRPRAGGQRETWRVRPPRQGLQKSYAPGPEPSSASAGVEIAHRRAERSLERRAATSLARLLAQEGLRDETRQGLAAVHGWFTEGFETADLKAAKGLLEQPP